jgi:hypothetical protein
MNIIAIDPSLNCTAMVVNDKKFIYAKEDYGIGKKGNLTKWFEICDPYISYKWINQVLVDDHSEQEILKLINYNNITDMIINDIFANCEKDDFIIGIEGYSYGSSAGPLIDLVTFGTLLRNKIYNKISHNIIVLPPATVKFEAARLTYLPVNPNSKNLKYRNNEGISGGSFKKPEMYKALIENNNLNCSWVELLREHASDVLSMKSIPKPIEDINDAKLLYEALKKHYQNHFINKNN